MLFVQLQRGGHIAKQCTKPKRKRDETWFNDKVLLVQAQAGSQALTEEEIAFLADPGLPDIQKPLRSHHPHAAYQARLDAYDYDCDELNVAKIALMANSQQETVQKFLTLLLNKISVILSMVEQLSTPSDALHNKDRESKPKLYEGNTILKMDTFVIPDSDLNYACEESSNSKNKVEAHSRNVKSSLNKRNGTVKVNGSAVVQNLKKQDNSDYVCINRDDCMSSDKLCVSNSMNDVKFRAKLKPKKIRHLKETSVASEQILDLFVNQTLREYYEKVGISHETSVARSPQQNGVVERRNRTLIEAARTMLIYAKAPLFLWAEAVATACYTQNRSMIRRRHGKTPYELLHDKPPDLSYLHVFGALCYPTNDCENLGKLQPKADIGIFIGYAPTKKAFRIYNRRTRRIIETIHVDFDELTAMASEHSSSGPALHEMTPVTISSGLVPNPPSSTPFVPPSRSDWDLLFQPMFDESLNPQPYVDLQAPEVIAPIPEVVAPEHAVLTTVDQDAPSPSNSHTTQETQTPIISHNVEEDNHDIEVAHMGNDPYFGIPIPEVASDQSSSSDVIHTIVPQDHQVSEHNSKWTKDHPLENIIDALDRPVST
ncbi:putative ribonuclease H-like domain-containing protein [Tanacetum coccineum]